MTKTSTATTTDPSPQDESRLLTELFTFQEVAERFRIPESTVRLWVQAQRIQHTRPGRHVRFSAEDLDAFIRSNRVSARSGRGPSA